MRITGRASRGWFGMAAKGRVCYFARDMKRPKQLTKRERKALQPTRPQPAAQGQHIHCVSCGVHLHAEQFDPPATATYVRCAHGSTWPACMEHVPQAREILAEHDRTGRPVQPAAAWH
jgi:hypothetical protein